MITKINAVQTQTNITSQPSFKGGRWNVIKYALNPNKKVSTSTLFSKLYINKDVIRFERENGVKNPVWGINRPLNRHKAGFLYRLASKFQNEFFKEYIKMENLQEKRQLVYDIFYKVKYPLSVHKMIAESYRYNLDEVKQIFELMNQDKSKLDLAKKLLTTFRKKTYIHIPAKEFIEILSSDNCKILNKKYSKVEKFIAEQSQNDDFSVSKVPQLMELFVKAANK